MLVLTIDFFVPKMSSMKTVFVPAPVPPAAAAPAAAFVPPLAAPGVALHSILVPFTAKDFLPHVTAVLTHDDCNDGELCHILLQMYAREQKLDIRFYRAKIGSQPPSTLTRDDVVLQCDFMYHKLDVKESRVIDHHVTNRDAVAKKPKHEKIFDMTKSASLLVWEFLYPNVKPPPVVTLVNDRDLYLFKDPRSLPFYEYSLTDPTILERALTHDAAVATAVTHGEALVSAAKTQIARIVKHTGYRIWRNKLYGIVNSSVRHSDIGNMIMKSGVVDFAIVFTVGMNPATYTAMSLRSLDSKTDVSVIAKEFEGGGHRNASGCSFKGLVCELPDSTDGTLEYEIRKKGLLGLID